VDASHETSESSLNETPASTLAAIGAASAITSKIGVKEEQSDSGKMFAPVGDAAAHSRDDGSISSKSDVDDQPVVTREDLDAAIQAGDWSAVSNTARLLANADPSATDLDNMSSSFKSQDSSLSGLSHGDVDRASEFSKLVEEGDWEGIMAAAAQFEGASDSESFASRRSMMSDSSVDSEFEPKTANDNTDKSKLRAEVESLVRTVVPDEIDNIDEMMLQFKGREDKLVQTLKTMQERNNTNAASPNEDAIFPSPGLSDTQTEDNVSVFEGDTIKSPWGDDSTRDDDSPPESLNSQNKKSSSDSGNRLGGGGSSLDSSIEDDNAYAIGDIDMGDIK
jgi:hypothetical protein